MIGTAKTILGALRGFPPLEWGALKSKIEGRGKAFPLMIISALLSLTLFADVTCSWDGTNWTCSGDGSEIVIGPGGSSGGVPPPETVVTNYIGVCTNCSNIAPADLRDLVDTAKSQNAQIASYAADIQTRAEANKETIQNNLAEIATYRKFDIDPRGAVGVTNYMYSVDNDQTRGMKYAFNYRPSAAFSTKAIAAAGAADGIYDYANNSVSPQLQVQSDFCDTVWSLSGAIVYELQSLDSTLDTIRVGAVECIGDGNPNNPSNTPSGTVSGNWCTKDQGNAITNLLNELKAYLKKVDERLVAQTNYQRECRDLIRSGLFTQYNAIPRQAQLGDWKDVYLDGNETNWGYQPTNILARIELLLYGMSGVSTNENPFTEGGTESTEVLDNFDDVKDDATTQLRAIDTDADGTEVQSLGQALIGFFNQFSISGDQASEGTEIWPSSVFRVGQEEYEIPTFTPTSGGASILNQAQSFSRVACIVIYFVLGAIVVFRFWTWFAAKAAIMSKWVVELLTSLFAS